MRWISGYFKHRISSLTGTGYQNQKCGFFYCQKEKNALIRVIKAREDITLIVFNFVHTVNKMSELTSKLEHVYS